MNKYVLIHVGFEQPTPAIGAAWGAWFEEISPHTVDHGNPFGPGREISNGTTTDLPLGRDSLTGYTIINAENLDAAEAIAATCPSITGIRIYPAMSM